MSNIYLQGYKKGEQGALLGIASNALLFVVKISAGIFGRSQAMIADAFHTASDAVTSICVLIGFKIARKPADKHHPFGHGRAESIMAKIVSIILILVGLGIAYNSASMLVTGRVNTPGVVAIFAAIISIIVKELTYRYVYSQSKKINSSSLKADAYHHRSDALSSVVALVGIAGARFGKTFLDPLAGIIIAGLIIKMGVESFHAAYDELMDAAPSKEFQKNIEEMIDEVEGVKKVKKIMARKSGIEFFVEATIGVDGDITVKEGHAITDKIRQNVFKKAPNVKDILVHVEPVKNNGKRT